MATMISPPPGWHGWACLNLPIGVMQVLQREAEAAEAVGVFEARPGSELMSVLERMLSRSDRK